MNPVYGVNERGDNGVKKMVKSLVVLPRNITIGEKYEPAMKVQTKTAAKHYFRRLVKHSMHWFGMGRKAAVELEKTNLGYFAGYYDAETRERVERLFECQHPYFGAIAKKGSPDPETAFNIGRSIGNALRS